VFVPFFNVEQACTTTGPTMLIKMSKCAVVMGSAFRNDEGIYEVIANTSIENEYPVNDPVEAAKLMNHHIESVIMKAPEQWMWTHKRFKSVPDETKTNSRYQ
jgi:KDO2-lipid IV(A) lauroyltransferase